VGLRGKRFHFEFDRAALGLHPIAHGRPEICDGFHLGRDASFGDLGEADVLGADGGQDSSRRRCCGECPCSPFPGKSEGLQRLAALDEVDLSDEVRNERGKGPLIDFSRGADLLDGPCIHHRHPVRDAQGFRLIVGHVESGHAERALDPADLPPHLGAQARVEI